MGKSEKRHSQDHIFADFGQWKCLLKESYLIKFVYYIEPSDNNSEDPQRGAINFLSPEVDFLDLEI